MKQSKVLTVIGWLFTAGVAGMMLFSAAFKFMRPEEEFVKPWTEEFGYPESAILPIAITEVACVLVYLIPRTSFLGAILVTGYLGGAIATHVRIGDPFIGPAAFGVAAWIGLYLRDKRVRSLVSFMKPLSTSD